MGNDIKLNEVKVISKEGYKDVKVLFKYIHAPEI